MTEARRWYDKDPVLKEALELLRLQSMHWQEYLSEQRLLHVC